MKPVVPKLELHVQWGDGTPRHSVKHKVIRRWLMLTLEHVCRSVTASTSEASETASTVVAQQLSLTVRMVAEAEGLALNQGYRGRDYATNVLTFPTPADFLPAGHIGADIALCWPVMIKEAQERNLDFLDHLAHLLIHACLHALGYDHETPHEAEIMEALEINILAKLGISNPYDDSTYSVQATSRSQNNAN